MQSMKKFLILFLALPLIFGGCARNISSDEYAESEIDAVKQTYKGVIIAARPVKVQGGDSLGDNKVGTIGGGAAGGLLGSQIGQGRGQVVGLVLGAVAGAVGGGLLEKGLKSQDGVEYTVELQSGRIMTIVQGPKPQLSIGQPVLVLVGSKGRPRIIADQFATQQAEPDGQPRRKVKKSASKRTQTQKSNRSINDIDYENRDRYARDQNLN